MPPLPVYVAPEWSGPPEGQTSFSLEVLKSGQVVDLIVLTTTTTTSKVDDDDVVPKSRSYVTFGRHPLCDVVIEHPSSSRLHCVLQFKKNTKEMYLFDPGSTHGVFVNKRKLKKGIHAPIFVGDQIKFGESTRDYIVQGDEALMPECGLTNRELEKVKEIQKRREMEQRRDEEEKLSRCSSSFVALLSYIGHLGVVFSILFVNKDDGDVAVEDETNDHPKKKSRNG